MGVPRQVSQAWLLHSVRAPGVHLENCGRDGGLTWGFLLHGLHYRKGREVELFSACAAAAPPLTPPVLWCLLLGDTTATSCVTVREVEKCSLSSKKPHAYLLSHLLRNQKKTDMSTACAAPYSLNSLRLFCGCSRSLGKSSVDTYP